MRRIVQVGLALALLASPAPARAHHRNESRDVPCERIHWQGVEDVRDAVRRLIRCAERLWPVPGGLEKALAVAECESGFRPDAYGSGNAGVYQHNLAYWEARWQRWGRPLGLGASPYNARTNVVVTMRMVHATRSWALWACA